MGWTHSVDFCQRVYRHLLIERGEVRHVPEIVGGKPAPPVREGALTAYVDNFISFGVDANTPGAL
eukprot:9503708-Pyramimonas_sp.AAC.1